MHEFSATAQIVDSVIEEVWKHNATGVDEVHLLIGELTFLGKEQVLFAYEVLSEGTVLEGSKLVIEDEPVMVACPECGYEGSVEYFETLPEYHYRTPRLACPQCDGKVDVVSGKGCTVRDIIMTVEE